MLSILPTIIMIEIFIINIKSYVIKNSEVHSVSNSGTRALKNFYFFNFNKICVKASNIDLKKKL